MQFHVLRELDTPWSGGGEAFVRALMIDCMMETDREAYKNKGNAYFAALKEFEGGRLAPFFRRSSTKSGKRTHGAACMTARCWSIASSAARATPGNSTRPSS